MLTEVSLNDVEVREAIVNYVKERAGFNFNPANVTITTSQQAEMTPSYSATLTVCNQN